MTRKAASAGLVAAIVGVLVALPAMPANAVGFSHTETISRTFLNADGTSTTVDSRTVTVNVSQTQDLRGRQQIDVSWSGAHPTGGIVPDPNSTAASREEYPVVILECRGLDAASAPAGQRLDPSTCWTQTPDERYQDSFSTAFPEWRQDRYETTADRSADVNAPASAATCGDGALVSRYVPFVGADGTAYPWGPNGVCGIPPEGSTVEDPAAPPANATYAVTGTDGKGAASFDIWTEQENASLGCSNTVPCALVVIPIMGISCDPAAASLPAADQPPADELADDAAECEKKGRYPAGASFSSDVNLGPGDTAVVGALWWSASNWRNRITVPLTFAPAANVCDIVDSRVPVEVYGSELMDQAAILWQSKFCQDPRLFKFEHVSTGEPQAESALASASISAAFISRLPDGGFSGPTLTAPVSVTGFAISYAIDDANKHQYTNLKLTPRLLAKLLSESYWGQTNLKTDYLKLPTSNVYAKMAKNPQDISRDPDFIALNPGIGPTIQTQAASALLALSGDTDVIYALTSYINADPAARAWLNGTPDPWGMTVNPAYKGIKLPLSVWPLLDTFKSPDINLDGCLLNEKQQLVPVPILPLIAAPMATLAGIAKAMQFAIANPQTACQLLQNQQTLQSFGGTLKALGRQPIGTRFMLGLTAAGDANLYGLHNAALQSSPGHFVTPTDASMRAAVATTKETSTHTWPFSYAKLRTVASAYPGTMVVYAAIPTRGVDATTAGHLAQFLLYCAGDGQKAGEDIGQLPPGYLPMTSGNGLSSMVSYTKQAATYVAAQTGETTPTNGSGSGNGNGSTTGGVVPVTPGAPSTQPTPSQTPYIPPIDSPVGYTTPVGSNAGSWTLPVVVGITLVAMIIAIIIRTFASLRAASNIGNRLQRLAQNGSGDRR